MCLCTSCLHGGSTVSVISAHVFVRERAVGGRGPDSLPLVGLLCHGHERLRNGGGRRMSEVHFDGLDLEAMTVVSEKRERCRGTRVHSSSFPEWVWEPPLALSPSLALSRSESRFNFYPFHPPHSPPTRRLAPDSTVFEMVHA